MSIPGIVCRLQLVFSRVSFCIALLCVCYTTALAQKSFVEGVLTYKVKLISADNQEVTGSYIITIKGAQLKKEMKLSNGYQDAILVNFNNNTSFALENRNGQKYAIQMNMDENVLKWQKYVGYSFKEDKKGGKSIAGYKASKGTMTYKDGTNMDVHYTSDWSLVHDYTFERFPGVKFLPLLFTYKDANGMCMEFEAEKVSATPVENAVFVKPADYKIISYNDYNQLMNGH